MKDLDRLIKQSLEEAGHSYSPRDEIVARERFIRLRRRRRTYWFAATAAATAMAVAVALFVVPGHIESPDDPIQVAARPLELVETIEVGGAPASVVSDGEAVWVSNAAGNSVVRVDPKTKEVVSVLGREGQTPDELAVAGGYLWVSTEEGEVSSLDGYTGEIFGDVEVSQLGQLGEPIQFDMDPNYLDITAIDGELWVAAISERHLYLISDARGTDGVQVDSAGLHFTDVASGDGATWGLTLDGAVHRLSTEGFEETDSGASGGGNADLAAGLGYVWVSSGDDDDLRLYRIDPSGEQDVLEMPLEGRYADLTVADGRLWVLAGGGEDSLLYRVTPDGAIEGDPLHLPGSVNDIAVGAGSAWVADTEAGTVLRIKEVSGDEPEPVATEPADDRPSSAQPFFAYSAKGEPFPDAGDIFVEMTDGTTEQITRTPDDERNPTFVFDSLVFERHDHETDWWGLVEHDLASGEEQSVPLPDGWEGGSHPAVSAGGDLAWAEATDEGGSIHVWPRYFVDRADKSEAVEVPLPDDLSDPRALIFSDNAKVLYYQAIGEGWVVVQVPLDQGPSPIPFVLNGVNDQPRGTTYVQPEDANDQNITALDVCCRDTEGDPYSRFSIARIMFTEGGATHEGITGPVALQDADPGALAMVSLHGAMLDEDGSWDLFADGDGSWLVSDGATLWLLHTDGGGQLASDTLETGADLHGFAVNPTLEGHS